MVYYSPIIVTSLAVSRFLSGKPKFVRLHDMEARKTEEM